MALTIGCVLVLGGCASLDDPGSLERDSTVVIPGQTLPDGSVRVDTDDARVAQLWSAAEQSHSEGDDTAALEQLFRALEIDQENALLWSRVAELQLDNGEPSLAETFAVKSNAFEPENRGLQYRNWLIIEHARTVRGDLLGVRSAHRQVQQYQYR